MIPEGEFQSQGGPLRPRRPWWFTLLLILLVLPAVGMPWVLVSAPENTMLHTLIKWFPGFLVLSAICAWMAYPARKDVSWILVAIMAMSSAALYVI